jgi:hypothetical protein
VEFDPYHSWFQQNITEDDDLRDLRRVTYVADRTPSYLLAITAQDYLYTKETKWEYEKEWRIILNFNSAACKVGKDDKGTDVLLFAIPPDCLISVTVGYNASLEFVEQVRTAIAANHIDTLPITEFAHELFHLEYYQIDFNSMSLNAYGGGRGGTRTRGPLRAKQRVENTKVL